MNLTCSKTSLQVTHRFSYIFTNLLLSRHTSKIAVEVSSDVVQQLNNNEIKARHHPGIVRSSRIALPPHIKNALITVVGDKPVKSLQNDCKMLNQYITSRHPPAERNDIRTKMRAIIEQLNQRMPPEELADLNEEDGAIWRRKREKAIERMLGQRVYTWKPIAYGAYEAVVYAIGRGALEYSILTNIFRELIERDPTFKVRSYFDFGSGVGTGMWAAHNIWKENIFEYYNVDSSSDMNELSQLILQGGKENQNSMLRNVYYRQFLPAIDTKYDLVVSAFTLFELPSAQIRKEAILKLWRKCDGYLVFVEEGTRCGSELINEARKFILQQEDPELKGHVFAPCAHDLRCPRMAKEDRTPCNFELLYTPLHVGGEHADHKGTRYSYVVLKKGEPQDTTRDWPRLVRPTLIRSKHVICRMCTSNAKLQEVIFTQAKHGRPAYRVAKVSRWGDRLPIALGELQESDKSTGHATDEELNNEEQDAEVKEALKNINNDMENNTKS